jgi:hypothetical protein
MTPLTKTIRREFDVDGVAFVVSINPPTKDNTSATVKVVKKGCRNGRTLNLNEIARNP